jgi:predicted kinase
MNVPKCYQLIGVPGSGKSTWVAGQDWVGDCVIASTDKLVDAYAQKVGKTYTDVFDAYMPQAVKLMADEVKTARSQGLDVIWDQTSTSVASRRKKFNMLPDYDHIAVVFQTPSSSELMRRLASRPGKNIPWSVVSSMINNFEIPTEEEGFKEIWYAC